MMTMESEVRATYRVCRGRFYVNDEHVLVNPRVLRIGVAVAGYDPDGACGPLPEEIGERILHMERSYLLSRLADALRRSSPERAA